MLDGCVPWPEELAAEYRRRGYWRGQTLGAALRAWAGRYGSRTAVVSGNRRLTYSELDRRTDRLAGGLAGLGIGARDRVVVQLPNLSEFVELFFALARLGALPVLALPAHRRDEIRALSTISEAVAYVIPDGYSGFDYRPLAGEVRAEVPGLRHVLVAGDPGPFTGLADLYGEPRDLGDPDPGDVALFLLSGGTTGIPKLIPRTHDDYAYNARTCAQHSALDQNSVYLVALPVAHNFALACPGVLGTLSVGGTVVMSPTPSPDDAFALIEQEGVTVTALVPALVQLWIQAREWEASDLSSLRLLQAGGALLAPDTARQVRGSLGCSLQQVYGMAEGLINATGLDDPEELIISTQGRPVSPADEIRIVDTSGADVQAGEIGELWTRGPYTLRGHYRADDHNRKAFTHDGFYRTGDLVRQLPSGHLMVSGRVKDVINRGGDKISAEEIETHLAAHPAIAAAAVVPAADAALGERICAFVVASGAAPSLETIRTFLRERGLASFKFPDRLAIVEQLPLTSVGKIDKKALASRALDVR